MSKHYTIFFALILLTLPCLGQNQAPARKTVLHTAVPQTYYHQEGLASPTNPALTTATNILSDVTDKPYLNASMEKGQSSVNPIPLGTASNAYTSIRTQQNQVIADPDLDLVAFIHRQNVNVHGGGGTQNGLYRYDLSIDGGQSFTNDIGPMQVLNTQYGRYPNLALVNPNQSSNPFETYLTWYGPTTNANGWIGHVWGTTDSTGAASSTEHYDYATDPTLIPGSLCEGLPGEYWLAELQYDGTNYLDSLYLYKGTWSASGGEVDYERSHAIYMPWDKVVDQVPHTSSPVISFSPDGQTGWLAMVGDLADNHSVEGYAPIIMKSTDAGATWSAPVEYDLNQIAWIADSLQSLWTDSMGNPASNGVASTAFDIDMTVDVNGDPHIIFTVGTAAGGYQFTSSLAMFVVDYHSNDGGSTWDATYLAPILTLRGEHGQPDSNGDLLPMDNYCQISRDITGEHIFYSWADTDSSAGNFGNSSNITPDLFISALRISDGYRTGYYGVTLGDLVWGGSVLFPTLAPTVLHDANNNYWKLPIVIQRLEANDQLQPVSFHYFGNDAVICEQDFAPASSLNLAWNEGGFPAAVCNIVSRPEPQEVSTFSTSVSPNPVSGQAILRFSLKEESQLRIQLFDLQGREILLLANRNYPAGDYEIPMDLSALSDGIYTLRLQEPDDYSFIKLIVHNR